ncbi:MCE family protein [Saccharopolyspora sp. HNM0986]|uniref:MlaD family protein n=1 Tax=Saccharopolyspora galaxeae TaxID=2781241 RepID=UPI00190AE3CF|nr:MlaD family protein [Saccharopolyspora sp. HNM0986]MBK0870395.1 MCE family protein [Saccharopolyspora sp. HNM0986]
MAAVSRPTTRSFLAGLVGLVVLGGFVFVGVTASSGLPGTPVTTVRAEFDHVGASLKVGNDVRENSSRIGEVSDLSYENGHAVVTLELDGRVPVYKDARAQIWDQSALAKKFVEIDRGHQESGRLGGQTIPAERNVGSADLDNVLDALDPKTREALTGTLREVGSGGAGHGQDINDMAAKAPEILRGLGNTSETLSDPQTDLPGLLHRADDLVGSLNGRERELADLVREVGDTAGAAAVDRGAPLQDSLKALPATLNEARTGLDSLDEPLGDVRSAVSDIRSGASALGSATPDVRGVLREGRKPLDMVPGVADKAEPAVEDLTQTVADARPLVPPLSRALTDAAPPVNTLAQYSPEVVAFFRNIESMVSTSVAPGVHGARVGVAAQGPAIADGGLLKDPLQGQDPYPAPGEVYKQRTGLLPNILTGGGQ